VTALRQEPLRAAALVLAAVLLALSALWATPAPAYACSCAGASDDQLAANADVIFTGTVTDDQVDEGEQTRTLTFTVDRVFKGQATATQVVTTHASGASCGLEISGPGPFLVFADQEQSGLTANLCGGTRAGSAPAGMGAGQAPLVDAAPDKQMGRWVPLVGMILAAAAATVVGLSLVRGRSARPEG
jgi:hypothetical protein